MRQVRGHKAGECCPRDFGGGQARSGVVRVSLRGRGLKHSTHPPLAWARSARSEKTRLTLGAEFPSPRRQWHPDDEYAFQVLYDITNFRSALSGPGNVGQRFAQFRFIIRNNVERD